MQTSNNDRSLGELFGDLSRDTGTLVRQEITLAKTEITQKATQAGKDIAFLAAGGAIAYAGFLAVLAAAIIGLAHVVPWWLSALIVGVVVAGIGFLLVQKGRDSLAHSDLAPRQAIDAVKGDIDAMRGNKR